MPSDNMANNKAENRKDPKTVTRKEYLTHFRNAEEESKKADKNYRQEYQEIAAAMKNIAEHVKKARIGKKENEDKVKESQRLFLGDMEDLLKALRLDIGTEEAIGSLQKEHVDQIGSRLKWMEDSFGKTNLVNNAEVSDPFRELDTKLIGIYNREHKAFLERLNKKSNEQVQSSPLMMLNDTLMQHPRHMDYPGVTAIQTLVSFPAENVSDKLVEKKELEVMTKRMSAHAGVSNSARKLAALICPMHAPDDNGETKNLSHEELTNLKAAYDDVLQKIQDYRDVLPKNHEYQKQLADISANMAKERTQVERAIKGIEDYVRKNDNLKKSVRPFSIYEIEGRTNPEFNNGFFKKAQAVKRTGDAFRERITQWRQDGNTKEMLKDYDDMMAAFDRLSNDVLPQFMKLDRGDRGYLPAMSPNEVADLRDAYQDAVIKIDQFVKTYGRKPKNEEQKDFQKAIFELYPDMVNKFRMLDQLVGGEDVRDLTEALDILNEKREDLAKKEPPKKEKDIKAQEEELRNLTEEEQRLKDVGYYQTLLDDGQLFPQMLFDSSESQRSADLAAMRSESQTLSGVRQDFNVIMTRNRRMRACPDTAVMDAALAVNPEYPLLDEPTTEGFNRHFEELKRQAMDLARKMTEFYEPDEYGRTKLMNLEEIREFEKAYSALASEAFMCDGWLPEGDPRKAAFHELDDLCEARKKSLRAAGEYIQKNAPEYREANPENKEVVPRTRAFSLYELQGGMNPEIDNNALDAVAQFKEEMDAYELSLNKLSTKEFRQMNPIRAEYKTFAREIDNLYSKVVPDMLRLDPTSYDFSQPVTKDKVREAMKEFEKATMAFIPLQVDFNNRKNKGQKPSITKEEEKMFATASQLYLRASQKWLAMNYLLDRTGNELMQDVERHNEQLDSLQKEIQAVRENQKLGDKKLSDEQLAKQKALTHDAKFLAWAMQLEDLLVNKKLTPAAIFEEDPSIGRSQILGELRLTEQNIYDVQMRAFYIGSQRWGMGGRRDLGDVKEFQTSLHQRNEFGTHTVMQYATKKKKMAKSIIDAALRNIPEKIKNQQFDIVVGEKLENDKKIPQTQKMTVEEAIRFYYQKKVDQMPDKTDLALANDINNNGVYAYETSGFAKAFKTEDLKNNRVLSYFLCDLNRALLNAGCCTDTLDLNLNDNIPEGYNQAYAKVAAQAIINDLAMQRSPEKGKIVIEERVDKDGNKPAANLLPETHLWEQTKFQFGDARPDQAFDVVIASTEKNFAEQVPGDKSREFYTTTKNFRSSSFVGFVPTSVTQAPEYRNGMTAMELAQAEEDITQFLYDQHTGQNKKADPVTSDVDDYVAYTDPTILANTADLQVMGYVLGIPKYRADQLRIGFKLDEKGNVYVSNVLGAETDEYLFSDLAPNDPALVSPDNMLVMTKEMANKIIDWSQGRFDANDRAVREAFKRLPQKALVAFQNRLNVMAAMIQKSRLQQDQFEDVVEENRKPGERPIVGLHTKPGIIRFLDRRDFDQLKLDDLAIGRNSGDYRTRETKPPVNIFDAVADLPKQSHLALMDKWGAIWSGDKSKEFGHLPESNLGKSNYNRNVHEPLYERKYLESERKRFLSKTARMIGDLVRMDMNRKNESLFHLDSGKYKDVLEAQEELQNALVMFDLDYTISSSQKRREMIQKHKAAIAEKDGYYARCAEVREQNRKIAEQNKKIAEENKKIADKSKHKKEIPYVPMPKRDRDLDAGISNLRYSLDYRDMNRVWEAMLKFRKKLEIYLKARVNPSSEFGKMRYAAMLKMYNDINNRLADYIVNTGDTRVLPTVAKLTEIPPKDGQPVPEDKKKYKITFEPMMEPGEWELRIPDVVREDYIRTVRLDIREKGDKNKKKTPQQVLAEADLAEKLIRKRYTEAQKTYDLNGRKKTAQTTLDESFEILDDAEFELLKKMDPARLRPVLLKKQQQPAPQAPQISREEQQRQANAEYERLLKGGQKQGGFSFADLSGEQPAPQNQNAQGRKKVNDVSIDQIIRKENGRNKDFDNLINNEEDDAIINDQSEDNLIINTSSKKNKNIINNNIINNNIIDNKEDNRIIINDRKDNKNIINVKEDDKIIINDRKDNKNIINVKEDEKIIDDKKPDGNKNDKKKGEVNDVTIDDIFSELNLKEDKPKTIQRVNNVNPSEPVTGKNGPELGVKKK